jgi:hypothetical protein
MSASVHNMTRDDLLAVLPLGDGLTGPAGEFIGAVLIPTEDLHDDSDYPIINVVLIRDKECIPAGRIGLGCDCIDIRDHHFRIEVMKKSGLLLLWADKPFAVPWNASDVCITPPDQTGGE